MQNGGLIHAELNTPSLDFVHLHGGDISAGTTVPALDWAMQTARAKDTAQTTEPYPSYPGLQWQHQSRSKTPWNLANNFITIGDNITPASRAPNPHHRPGQRPGRARLYQSACGKNNNIANLLDQHAVGQHQPNVNFYSSVGSW
jgi:hypothetical protein